MEPAVTSQFRQILLVVDEFLGQCSTFGPPVTDLIEPIRLAFQSTLNFITAAITMSRPEDKVLQQMLTPIIQQFKVITDVMQANRGHVLYNHISLINESICSLGFISAGVPPAVHIRNMREAGEYYAIRILKDNKQNAQHSSWVNRWRDIIDRLEAYAKEFHLAGFAWNSVPSARGAEVAGAKVAPPPPPPPPMALPTHQTDGDNLRLNLMREINCQGENIASRLKHRSGDAAPSVQRPTQARPGSKFGLKSTVPSGNRKVELSGNQWIVEYVVKEHDLVIQNRPNMEIINMFRSNEMGVTIMEKVTVLNCNELANCMITLKQGAIAAVEVTHCKKVKIICQGNVPTINVEHCEEIEIYLSESSMDVEINTSHTSTVNVLIPQQDGDYKELILPEQIRSNVVNGKIKSAPIYHDR